MKDYLSYYYQNHDDFSYIPIETIQAIKTNTAFLIMITFLIIIITFISLSAIENNKSREKEGIKILLDQISKYN